MMDAASFGSRIKEKYPDGVAKDGRRYSDIDDVEIASMWVKAKPVYQGQVSFGDQGKIETLRGEAQTAEAEAQSANQPLSEKITDRFADRAENIEENKAEADLSNPLSIARQTFQNAGQVAGGVNDALMETADAALMQGKVGDVLKSEPVKKAIGTGLDVASRIAGVSGITDALKNTGVRDKISSVKEQHPEYAQDMEAAANIASLVPIGKGAKLAKDVVVDATKTGASQALEATGLKSKMYTKAVDDLEQDYLNYSGLTKSGSNKAAKSANRTDAMNAAGTEGKTPQRTLAEAGIIPEHSGTKLTTAEQAIKFRESIDPLDEALGDSIGQLRYATAPTPIDDLIKRAVQRISKQTMPEGDKAALIKEITDEFDLLRAKYGDSLTIQEMYDTKPGYWKGTKFDSTKPFKGDSYYQVGKSLQEGIQNSAKAGGYDDVAQLAREIGDRLEAAKYLDSLNGQTVKRGSLGKYVAMGIGASLGTSLPTKILGAIGGEVVAQTLIDVSVSSPVKRLILNSIKKRDPAAFLKTVEWMKQQGIEDATRLALPEGAIQLPSGTESFVQMLKAPKGEIGRTPKGQEKGGQFFRTFSSDITPKKP